jgi:ribonuclease HI
MGVEAVKRELDAVESNRLRLSKEMKMGIVRIHTAGSCWRNPGPGGYACIMLYHTKTQGVAMREVTGFDADSTSMRIQMKAVIEGLRSLTRSVDVEVYTDSSMIRNAFSMRWIDAWEQADWTKKNHEPVANREYWISLLAEVRRMRSVKFTNIMSPAEFEFANRCDALAKKASVDGAAQLMETSTANAN